MSRESLARDVWKETARTTPLDNVIDVHIARLRRKIDADQGDEADSHRARRRVHAARGRAMRRWWRSHSVRVRLTLWYVAAMVVVLAVYAAVVFAFVNRSVSETLEQAVARRLPVGLRDGGADAGRRHHLVRGHHRRGILAACVERGRRAAVSELRRPQRSPVPESREIAQRADDSIVEVESSRGAGARAHAARADRRQRRSSSRSVDRKRPCARSWSSSRSSSRSGCRWRWPSRGSAATRWRGARCCRSSA